MTINHANLSNYISDRQTEAMEIQAILQGVDILMEEERGKNAAVALIVIAMEKVDKLQHALDSVAWPKAVADDIDALPNG